MVNEPTQLTIKKRQEVAECTAVASVTTSSVVSSTTSSTVKALVTATWLVCTRTSVAVTSSVLVTDTSYTTVSVSVTTAVIVCVGCAVTQVVLVFSMKVLQNSLAAELRRWSSRTSQNGPCRHCES